MSSPEWRVSRGKPGCYIFLLDQSFSMDDPFAGTTLKKSEVLASAINRYICELVTLCEKDDGPPRHYFDLAVIGYTTDDRGAPEVRSALGGALASGDPMFAVDIFSITELSENPLRLSTANGITEPIWFDPVARYGTPMCAGMEYCYRVGENWAASHPESVPPIFIHITDGESSDGDPEPIARALQTIRTHLGNALVFNFHLSSSALPGIILPSSEQGLPDDNSRLLYRMSSPLPDFCQVMARTLGYPITNGARGMAFNADATVLSSLVSVGTLPQDNRPPGLLR